MSLTVMPRPTSTIPLMMAVMVPEAIYHCTRRGFHIMTTPLSGDHQQMLDQVEAFNRGKQERGTKEEEVKNALLAMFEAEEEKAVAGKVYEEYYEEEVYEE